MPFRCLFKTRLFISPCLILFILDSVWILCSNPIWPVVSKPNLFVYVDYIIKLLFKFCPLSSGMFLISSYFKINSIVFNPRSAKSTLLSTCSTTSESASKRASDFHFALLFHSLLSMQLSTLCTSMLVLYCFAPSA